MTNAWATALARSYDVLLTELDETLLNCPDRGRLCGEPLGFRRVRPPPLGARLRSQRLVLDGTRDSRLELALAHGEGADSNTARVVAGDAVARAGRAVPQWSA